jgi:hypothetical protein
MKPTVPYVTVAAGVVAQIPIEQWARLVAELASERIAVRVEPDPINAAASPPALDPLKSGPR